MKVDRSCHLKDESRGRVWFNSERLSSDASQTSREYANTEVIQDVSQNHEDFGTFIHDCNSSYFYMYDSVLLEVYEQFCCFSCYMY